MRGTTNKADFDLFVKAVAGFPPTERDGKTAQEVFKESYAALDKLASKKRKFPRAIAWKAYALALSVYEGWELPNGAEKEMKWKARLDHALRLAKYAVRLDKTDYDLHWALADVHLIRAQLIPKEFKDAINEFEIALDLNRDERHPSLFVEAASAMMQAGDFQNAEAHYRKARAPDWHIWMHGIFLFLKAGRAVEDQETFLNIALEELKGARNQFEDDFYQSEIQLLLAAVHWRKSVHISKRAGSTKNADAAALLKLYAARNMDAARRAIRNFRRVFKDWDEKQAITALSLKDPRDRHWWKVTMNAVWAL